MIQVQQKSKTSEARSLRRQSLQGSAGSDGPRARDTDAKGGRRPSDHPDLPEADVPEALAEDLAELFGESVPVAPEVDEAVLADCSGHTAFKVFQEVFSEEFVFFGLGSQIELAD